MIKGRWYQNGDKNDDGDVDDDADDDSPASGVGDEDGGDEEDQWGRQPEIDDAPSVSYTHLTLPTTPYV